jgi:hypothetical protein
LATASRLRRKVEGVGCCGSGLRGGNDNRRAGCEQDQRRL